MIYGNDLTDCAITGEGISCGGREKWGAFQALQTPARTRSHTLELEGVPVDRRIFGEGSFLRPSMLQFRKCRRILLEGISLIDAPLWMIHPLFCSHVTIRHVTTDSMYVCNDGIDVDSCTDVLIEKSHFRNGDDAVVLKSGRDADGRRVGLPSKRIVVRDCFFCDCMHGFAIGSELSGGAEDVYVYDIRMEYIWGQAISFKSCPGRGGVIRNIHVGDIQIDRVNDHVISIVSEYVDIYRGDERTCYRDFELLNIHCDYARNGFVLEGSEAFPLENILLADVTVTEAPTLCTGIKFPGNLELRNVCANGRELSVSLLQEG
jgi:polygalacturonase